MKRCNAKFCKNNTNNCELSFFQFPKDPERFKIWATFSKRSDLIDKKVNYKNYSLCSAHFAPEMFTNDVRNRLERNAVPQNDDEDNQAGVLQQIVDNNKVSNTSEEQHRSQSNIVDPEDSSDDIVCLDSPSSVSSVETTHVQTQTSLQLSSNTPRKRKLHYQIDQYKKQIQSFNNRIYSLSHFYELCDLHLPENMSKFVKKQATIYSNVKNNKNSR